MDVDQLKLQGWEAVETIRVRQFTASDLCCWLVVMLAPSAGGASRFYWDRFETSETWAWR